MPTRQQRDFDETWRGQVTKDASNLHNALLDMLEGPFRTTDAATRAKPVLLIVDDLEQILETPKPGEANTPVKTSYSVALASIIAAFRDAGTESHLLLTSRYTFALTDARGDDLAARLITVQLPPMDERQRDKQMRAAARLAAAERAGNISGRSEAALEARIKEAAKGNPGLQAILSRPLLSGDIEATIKAVEAVEGYLKSGEVSEDLHAAADFFSSVSLTAFRDMLTPQETQQLRAATLFSAPVPRPVLAAAGEAAFVKEPVRAIERLRGLGLVDLYLAAGAKEEFSINSLARPLVSALSEAENAQIAERAIAPLYSEWKDADGNLPADLRGWEAARLALLGQAAPDIVNASSLAAVVFLFHGLHQAQPALELVLAALSALDRAKALPDLHLLRHGADCAERLGKADVQEMLLERGLAIEGGDPRPRAMLLSASASRLIRTGRIDSAGELLKEAAVVFASLGDVRSRAVTMGQIADILQARGQLDEALAMHSDRLPVAEAMGDVDSIAHAKFSCASIRLHRGGWQNGEAETILEELAESFSIAMRMQRTDFIAGIGAQLGPVLAMAGMRDDSLAVLETAVAAFETLKQTERAQQLRDLQETIRSMPTENVGETANEAEISEANPSLPPQQPFDPVMVPPPAPPSPPTRGISNPAEESAATSPQPQTDKAEYIIWYGTNRRRNDSNDAGKGYSAARDNVVHYGSCRLFIPQSHKIGSIGSPWWKRLLTWTDDRLRLLSINEFEQSAYWDGIVARLTAIDAIERNALIFVHGYNVSFQEAALRAAQIGFDLSVKGAMAFFSWPSQGSTGGYSADEATIEASEGVIADFMSDFAEKSGATAVHIIAHSMGNRGVLRAVNRIAVKAERRTGKPFGQIILAAADVDADVFRQLSAAYAQVANRTTLYVSKRDLAVEASRWLHNFPRAGLMPPTLVLPGIDTINVTNVDLTMLGHGYVADARDVLTDMHALITRGASPNERFGLRETQNEDGERYWLIGA